MNAKLIIYRKEKIQNYESLKQLCLLMNIEIILLNEQMTQNSTLCLKAVVTATNYNWTFEKLVLHLLEEYQKNK